MDKIIFEVNEVQEHVLYLALCHYHNDLFKRASDGDMCAKELEPVVWGLIQQQVFQQAKKKSGGA